MKSKHRAIIVLTMLMLVMGLVLTGCNDRDNYNTPSEITQPTEQPPRERDPNAPLPPLPPRNPDGTLG